MKLTPEQTLILVHTLIRQLVAAGSVGVPLATLKMGVHMAGFVSMENEDLDPHLHFLVSDGLATVAGAAVSAALKRWTITSNGMRYAQENGLV